MSRVEGAAEPEDRRPIGVFDSGIGGLTVVKALLRQLPRERILYLGDTARLPYGTKSADTVARYSQRNVDHLVAQGVKSVVVACNSASALALERIVAPVPIWGVLRPGAAVACRVTRSGHVGVIATESTVRSDAYRRALLELRPELEVTSVACSLFVPLVEEGWTDGPITEAIARRYLEPLLDCGADTVVLGCTHYPLLRGVIEEVLGSAVTLVDSGEAVAEEVRLALRRRRGDDDEHGEQSEAEPVAGEPLEIRVTDDSERFTRMARRVLGGSLAGREARLHLVDL